ncbi:MAG: RluA family pseudouridine synthase [Spirochaetaceae bacterium]|nr:RluA family pseudouridine synthase [Spirochaetaceae bacterium]
MDFIDFTADENDAGRRIDKIVRRLMPDHSLGMIYKYFRKGLVRKNKGKTKPEEKINIGDNINIAAFLLNNDSHSESQKNISKKSQIHISLGSDLFLNQHIRIINKPYDIPVQGGKNISLSLDTIISQEYLQMQQEKGRAPSLSFRPGPLHRLDRKTTGILAFSQSLLGAQWFSQAIKDHTIGKEYLALVEGHLQHEQIWQEEIARQAQGKSQGFVQSQISKDGKKAHTKANPIAWGTFQGKHITLVHLEIATGRTHQIRLHCSHHGFPLLGDTAYGGSTIITGNTKKSPQGKISQIQEKSNQDFFLHAWKMRFPTTNPLQLPPLVEAPLSENFRNMIVTHLPEMELKGYII